MELLSHMETVELSEELDTPAFTLTPRRQKEKSTLMTYGVKSTYSVKGTPSMPVATLHQPYK